MSRYLVAFLAARGRPVFVELSTDWRVFGFMAGLAVVTCILFGLTPALRASGVGPASAMKASSRGLTADRNRFGLRRALVVSQVALSLVLLVGALLFVRSLRKLTTLDAGFNENGLLNTEVNVARLNFPPERRAALYDDLLRRVRAIPGVGQAATANIMQISGNGWNNEIVITGQPPARMVPWFDRVSPGYFRTMGTQLVAGRDFDQRDTTSSPEVAIVNQEFSRKFLAGANPIGKSFRVLTGPGEPPHVYQIVGLVKNSKYQTLREEFKPLAFVAESQDKEPNFRLHFIVRSSLPVGALMSSIKKIALEENPDISLEFKVFTAQVQESLLRERLMATLSGFFGFLAVVLATVGLYGVISYMVARRSSEIGIRIALGANRANVLNLVMREAGMLLAAGLVIGTVLAIAVARTTSSLLFGLQPSDPVTIGLSLALLAMVALAASLLPALRASRVEPMSALREE